MITARDIEVVNRLLAEYAAGAVNPWMDEIEFVARRLGDISRNRATRLIIAARQGITTQDLQRRRKR
jgi:hypothetical protein